ncbi:hypothetical protein [Sorangium sp. So ce145]|uniref:hypothetical protein n=1 Tax=Sorangium sp. So ce145 TaxID=3133285 RepID=UPI003F5F11AC
MSSRGFEDRQLHALGCLAHRHHGAVAREPAARDVGEERLEHLPELAAVAEGVGGAADGLEPHGPVRRAGGARDGVGHDVAELEGAERIGCVAFHGSRSLPDVEERRA